MKENFFIVIESLHIQDEGSLDNVKQTIFKILKFKFFLQPFNLSIDKLKKREIIYIDIANDPIAPGVSLDFIKIFKFLKILRIIWKVKIQQKSYRKKLVEVN